MHRDFVVPIPEAATPERRADRSLSLRPQLVHAYAALCLRALCTLWQQTDDTVDSHRQWFPKSVKHFEAFF